MDLSNLFLNIMTSHSHMLSCFLFLIDTFLIAMLSKMKLLTLLSITLTLAKVAAFSTSRQTRPGTNILVHATDNEDSLIFLDQDALRRRSFLQTICAGAILFSSQSSLAANKAKLPTLLSQIKEARSQLGPVQTLIKEEKWDSVRAILITPPLSDCWNKSAKLLNSYAKVIGDELPDGDELAALEFKEEALDHIRFLDMAAYNNVFNPIRTEGKSGATKELISSYYDDPVNEVSMSITF
jgi:hypothetical protein